MKNCFRGKKLRTQKHWIQHKNKYKTRFVIWKNCSSDT